MTNRKTPRPPLRRQLLGEPQSFYCQRCNTRYSSRVICTECPRCVYSGHRSYGNQNLVGTMEMSGA